MHELDRDHTPKYHDTQSDYFSHKTNERGPSERPSVSHDHYASNTKSENMIPFPMESKRSTEKRSYRKEYDDKYSCKIILFV